MNFLKKKIRFDCGLVTPSRFNADLLTVHVGCSPFSESLWAEVALFGFGLWFCVELV